MSEYTGVYVTRSSEDELKHWKYIKKVKKNGKWKYYYDKDELLADMKDKFNSIYNDPNNIYDINSKNYNKKIEEVKKSKEWKDIVKREDPEYVKKNADGSKTYYIDDYIVKKKHPELDVISDLGSGRKISLNKITAKSLIAGAKDYINTAKNLVGVYSVALTEKFKFSQGSYNKQVKSVKSTATNTYKKTKSTYTNSKTSYDNTVKKVNDTYSNVTNSSYKYTDSEELANSIESGARWISNILRDA